MNPQELQDHVTKETIKRYIDSCLGFSDFVKRDLKLIIDTSQASDIALQKILAYFAGLRW